MAAVLFYYKFLLPHSAYSCSKIRNEHRLDILSANYKVCEPLCVCSKELLLHACLSHADLNLHGPSDGTLTFMLNAITTRIRNAIV